MVDRFFIFVETYVFPVLVAVVTLVGVGQAFVPQGWKTAAYALLGM